MCPSADIVTFSSSALIPAGTTVSNLGGNNVVFLNVGGTNGTITAPGRHHLDLSNRPGGTCTNNIPVSLRPGVELAAP